MPTKKRFKPPEQLKIAGTARPDPIPELTEIAEDWRELDEQSAAIKDEKKELAERLVDEMQHRGIDRHVYEGRDGLLHEVTIKELKVKVKIQKLVTPHRRDEADADAEKASN